MDSYGNIDRRRNKYRGNKKRHKKDGGISGRKKRMIMIHDRKHQEGKERRLA